LPPLGLSTQTCRTPPTLPSLTACWKKGFQVLFYALINFLMTLTVVRMLENNELDRMLEWLQQNLRNYCDSFPDGPRKTMACIPWTLVMNVFVQL